MDEFERVLEEKYRAFQKGAYYTQRTAGDTASFRYPHLADLSRNFSYNTELRTFLLEENIETAIKKISINEITLYELMCEHPKKLHLYDFLSYKAGFAEKLEAYNEVSKAFAENRCKGEWDESINIKKININDLIIRDEFEHLKTFIQKSKNTDIYICSFLNAPKLFQFGCALKGTNVLFSDDNKANISQELFHMIYHLEEGIPGFHDDNMNIVETWANADALYLKQTLEGRLTRRRRKNNSPHDIKFLDYVFLRAYIGQAFLDKNETAYFHSVFSLIEPAIKLLVSSFNSIDIKATNAMLIDGICKDKTENLKSAFNEKYGSGAYDDIFYNSNLFGRMHAIKEVCAKNAIPFNMICRIMFSSGKMLPTVLDNSVVELVWSNPWVHQDKDLVLDLIEDFSQEARREGFTIDVETWMEHIGEKFGKQKKIEICALNEEEEMK